MVKYINKNAKFFIYYPTECFYYYKDDNYKKFDMAADNMDPKGHVGPFPNMCLV